MLETHPPQRRTSRSWRAYLPVRMLRSWYRLHRLLREGLKFATVGSVGYIVDIGIFNALLFAGGEGPLHDKPLIAKTVSVLAATVVTYTGHRVWTFRHRARVKLARGYPLFFLFNGIGLGIALSCLAVSRYALGMSGPLADNISANVVGLLLGTLFRYWSYRTWVFPAHPAQPAVPATGSAQLR
ncbi:GtrA family protein [Phytoactinopolyspora limicola]|uniref:GtrA family protein n=1 Tax=Phytoactinopolyspora limicola TaxID=2715536 RepID=UPI001A9C7F8E|nr:GtrA family protein [Phytoactinopolyspora limicola]